ncbi:isopeptide-forming domain-containing fimbrial protein [bacterium]|nr:isopeptide-forming domain-containing fimbrial protein [bacterium]
MNVTTARGRLAVLFAALAAALVALVLATPAHAAGTGTITINPPANTPSEATTTYKIYKVFDADGNGTDIRYTLPAGKTLTADMQKFFSVDEAGNVSVLTGATDKTGNLSADAIAAIKKFVTDADLVDGPETTGTTPAISGALPNGYYYITTSTGSAVTITSANPNAVVVDKGTIPSVTKKITAVSTGSVTNDGQNALAESNATVSYEADITIVPNSTKLSFYDMADASLLSLDKSSIKVMVGTDALSADDYTLSTTDSNIQIDFVDKYLAGITADTVVKVTYNETVVDDTLSSTPAKNLAYVTYGTSNSKVSAKVPEVYNAKITVTKQNGAGNPLAGAGFVLKRSSDNAYYRKDGNVVTWVANIAQATEYDSDAKGAVTPFQGLADGSYTLIESVVPSGYNKAADTAITVKQGEYTPENLEQAVTIVNHAGTALPTTGGAGTVAFTVVGAVLVVGAGVALITRKRMEH